jgi:hypothetical protein
MFQLINNKNVTRRRYFRGNFGDRRGACVAAPHKPRGSPKLTEKSKSQREAGRSNEEIRQAKNKTFHLAVNLKTKTLPFF